jgi:LAS superfamily LD-carboxypeptidase LdcB
MENGVNDSDTSALGSATPGVAREDLPDKQSTADAQRQHWLDAFESPGGGRIRDKTEPQPSLLVLLAGYGGVKVPLHRAAAEAWVDLMGAARRGGIPAPLLLPISGYRAVPEQEALWNEALQRYGSEETARIWVARPGMSAHQSGRAIDCWLGTQRDSENVTWQRGTTAWLWLRENASAFGFFPYEAEPWHWEFNPPWHERH